jgi:hypothetical protein
MKSFEVELKDLINKHSVENVVNMPDYILSNMICRMIELIGSNIKQTFPELSNQNHLNVRKIKNTKMTCYDCEHSFENPFDQLFYTKDRTATRVCKEFSLKK